METETLSTSLPYDTEEKTEPFPSTEYASRLRALRAQQDESQVVVAANSANTIDSTVSRIHLDELVVPTDKDIRLLVRPLRSRSVSPGTHDGCEWMALRSGRTDLADEAAEPNSMVAAAAAETVLAVTQTSKDIKFNVHMPGEYHTDGTPIPPLLCDLYYDSASDNQILVNRCEFPIRLFRVYPSSSLQLPSSPPSTSDGTPVAPGTPVQSDMAHTINPDDPLPLSPGTWRIKVGDIEVLDFRILERRRTMLKSRPPSPPAADSQATTSSAKRSISQVVDNDADEEARDARRQKVTAADGDDPISPNSKESAVVFIRPTAAPFVFPLPDPAQSKQLAVVSASKSHALLEMRKDSTAIVQGQNVADSYSLTKRENIASTSLSTVFTASLKDHPDVPAGCVVTVKVIKSSAVVPSPSPSPAAGGAAGHEQAVATANGRGQARPHEIERRAVRQADSWQREVESHGRLQHDRIVRLYAADARYLSLYMEHVDAKDLSRWREESSDAASSDYFRGSLSDAVRILQDISRALHYIHNLGVVHNDIKPANILYSAERGAVLCDFGLSTKSTSQPSAGGTPYYVPPEFIGYKLRGPPSDVWALGITMLYVLRKIAFPDTRGARKQRQPLYWLIAEVNNKAPGPASLVPPVRGAGSPTSSLPAVTQMQMWLSEVRAAREKLNRNDKIERLTYEMLSVHHSQRITMKRVVHELFAQG